MYFPPNQRVVVLFSVIILLLNYKPSGGLIYLSNISIATDGFRSLKLSNFLYNRNSDLLAWSVSLHWAWVNNPFDENVTPK